MAYAKAAEWEWKTPASMFFIFIQNDDAGDTYLRTTNSPEVGHVGVVVVVINDSAAQPCRAHAFQRLYRVERYALSNDPAILMRMAEALSLVT